MNTFELVRCSVSCHPQIPTLPLSDDPETARQQICARVALDRLISPYPDMPSQHLRYMAYLSHEVYPGVPEKLAAIARHFNSYCGADISSEEVARFLEYADAFLRSYLIRTYATAVAP